MDKLCLRKIFLNSFNHSEWIEIQKDVFGASQLLVQPNQIMLPSSDKAKATVFGDGILQLSSVPKTNRLVYQ